MARWINKYSAYDYPLLSMLVINSSEEKAIEAIVETMSEEELRILLTQMSHFASMSYDQLVEKYGKPPNKGDHFIAILGSEEISVRGRMKRYMTGPWILVSLEKEILVV